MVLEDYKTFENISRDFGRYLPDSIIGDAHFSLLCIHIEGKGFKSLQIKKRNLTNKEWNFFVLTLKFEECQNWINVQVSSNKT